MTADLIIPIESLKGKLRNDGFYFRLYKGKQIVQRCPTQWKDTPARKAAREKFAATWGQRYAHSHTMRGNEHTEDPHQMRENEHTRPDNISANERNY